MLFESLPKEIQIKILLYISNPTADFIKAKFKLINYDYNEYLKQLKTFSVKFNILNDKDINIFINSIKYEVSFYEYLKYKNKYLSDEYKEFTMYKIYQKRAINNINNK